MPPLASAKFITEFGIQNSKLERAFSEMEEIHELLRKIGPGRMSSTAYDTAWVARLNEVDPLLGNNALEWINANQLPDGSWGTGDILYYHDRVVCTLAAMIALTHRGRRANDKLQIENGLYALERITKGATQGAGL
jgi:halimadienyl-diphosphate synthase